MKDMTPVPFPQVNVTYQPPSEVSNVAALPAYRDGRFAISCWRVPFIARVVLFFTGRVWFTAMAADHPPVKLSVKVPFVPAPKPVKAAP